MRLRCARPFLSDREDFCGSAPSAPVSPPSPPQTPPATPPSPAPRPDWDALRDVARRDGEAASRALRLADDALRRRSSSFLGWTP